MFAGAPTLLGDGAYQTQILGATGLPVRVEFSIHLLHWQIGDEELLVNYAKSVVNEPRQLRTGD